MYKKLEQIVTIKKLLLSNVPTTKTKELFVSTDDRSLVGTFISKGEVSDIFAIGMFTHAAKCINNTAL